MARGVFAEEFGVVTLSERQCLHASLDSARHPAQIDRAYVLGPMQFVASQFLMTMKEFPPSQTPGDWSLATLEAQIKRMTKGD